MIKIISFSRKKGDSTKPSNGAVGFANTPNTNTDIQGVYLWGQYHDHKQDVSGDLNKVGNISANGYITTNGDISAENITARNHLVSEDLTTKSIQCNGTINAENIDAKSAIIDKISSTTINVDNLTVTRAAHFYKLLIDQVKASKGQIFISPFNATIADAEKLETTYIIYFLAEDPDTKQTSFNGFEVGDQILCQTFDVADSTTMVAQNKFYWAIVSEVSSIPEEHLVNGQNILCHHIVVEWNTKDSHSNGVPEKNDEIVVCGNRQNAERQNVITIGAYENPILDTEINPPFIVQYAGINDYNLSTHRKSVISKGYNLFNGTFTTTSGDNIEDLINDVSQGAMTYLHTAYSNSADGSLNFSKTYFTDAIYMGVCSNHTESDETLTYTSYTWMRIKGEDGGTAETYTLYPITENCPIDQNATVGLFLKYNIIHQIGNQVEIVTSSNSMNIWWKPFYVTALSKPYKKFPNGTTEPSYVNASFQTNYNTEEDKIQYITIVLSDKIPSADDVTIYDQRIVYPTLLPSASFYITDSIKSTVQGHTDDINGITNSISTINQQYNQISATVTSNTTNINQNKTDIASLKLNTKEIELKLNETGINIQDKTIKLNADNTSVYGNLKLYNKNNGGFSIYDEDDFQRINVQAKPIGDITIFNEDDVTEKSMVYNGTPPSYNISVEDSLGSYQQDTTISIENIQVRFENIISPSSSDYPTQSMGKLKMEIYLGSSVKTYTTTFEIYKKSNLPADVGIFVAKKNFRIPIKLSDSYSIKFTTEDFPTITNGSVKETFTFTLKESKYTQTYIGSDGIYSHIDANAYIWANPEQIALQHGFCGLKFQNGNSYQCIKSSTNKSLWTPSNNYVPLVKTSVNKYKYKKINNTDQYKWVWLFDAAKVNGYVVVDETARGNNFSAQDVWIELPTQLSTNISDVLPAGYVVTIVKAYTESNLYVTATSTSKDGVLITDLNDDMRKKTYINLNNNYRRSAIFIHLGNNQWICD